MNLKTILGSASFGLLLAATASAQVNDDCSGAISIAGYGTFPFDNSNATPSGINDCNNLPVRKDLWYSWTAPATDYVRFETCNTSTSYDTRIAVYDAQSTCNSLTLVACAGNTSCGLSRVQFDAIAGQSYLLRVGSRAVGDSGPGEFRLEMDPCGSVNDDSFEDNDVCASAAPVGNGTYNNLWVSKIDPDWYEFCIDAGGLLTVDFFFSHSTGDLDAFAYETCGGAIVASSGSASDDEQIVVDNTASSSALVVRVRLEHWMPDTVADCNDYSMVVTGAGSSCNPGIGTNYCTAVPNSTGLTAAISANGSDVASDNDVTLRTADMPLNSFAFFIVSDSQGFVAGPGGSQGNLCLGGSIGRYVGPGQIQTSGGTGTISLMIDLTQVPTPTGFVSTAPGQTWNFQSWYRDAVGGSATSNFSDGLSILFQ